MNLFGLSPGELFLIMFVAMIVLGPEKLPETAASVGKWIREFRRATQELTQQFQDDNPFAEIQRALNFNEEPVAATPAVEPVDATPAVVEQNTPESIPASVAPVAPAAPPSPAPVPRSDYFDRPAVFDPIEDRWAHGSIEDFTERVLRRLQPQMMQAIGDEWAHGVPVVAAEAVSANGHSADTNSDWVNSLNFGASVESGTTDNEATVEASSTMVDAPVVESSPVDTDVTAGQEPGSEREESIPASTPAPPTSGISVDVVMTRESEPVTVGSSSGGGVGDGGGH